MPPMLINGKMIAQKTYFSPGYWQPDWKHNFDDTASKTQKSAQLIN